MLEKSVFKNSVKLGHSVILCFEILDERRTAFGKVFFKWSKYSGKNGRYSTSRCKCLIRVQKNRKKVLGFLRNSYLI